MPRSKREEALELIRKMGVARPRDLATCGIRRDRLASLVREGLLDRVGRGLYMLPDTEVTEHHSLAEASKRVPHGIVCLLSALCYHEIGTQNPYEVWMAIGRTTRVLKTDGVATRILRFSGRALEYGVEEHEIDGVTVRVYSPAKAVSDCFKYRNKTGLDVALEALRECWRERKVTMNELWKAAEVCRVARVMRPYLESLI